jgi:uridylate kinase
MSKEKPAYNRILLKLSGESLLGDLPFGIDIKTANSIAQDIKEIHDLNVQIAIMIGGGNLFRGIRGTEEGMDRASADYMGLMATIMNAIALQDALEKVGCDSRHICAIEVKAVAEPFIRGRVIRHLEKGRVVIFSAGLGSPYFTTDTASALRALEIGADVIFKATKVDGAYSADPIKDKSAKKFAVISHEDVIKKGLQVMDTTAFTLCKENKMPIVIFNLKKKSNLKNAVLGLDVGTKIF